jgi:hypothetical protein
MTVNELIKQLEVIKDKSRIVIVRDCDGYTEATEVVTDAPDGVYIE